MLLALLLAGLPGRVDVETERLTFTRAWEVAVDDGRLHWRRRGTTDWRLMPPDGLPAPRARLEAIKEDVAVQPDAFERPDRIERISADGDLLLAVSGSGRAYVTRLPALDWRATWGPPGAEGPLLLGAGHAPFALSLRRTPSEDLDGNVHSAGPGVTTIYSLRDEGRRLELVGDRPDLRHVACLPERNTFVAAALAASASTVFVMDASGRAFTRLVDLQTLGLDPTQRYTYQRERRRGPKASLRTLPAEPWLAQPRIDGVHSTHLTVVQTGPGHRDRELRVEGDGGYWRKLLSAPAWTFERTQEAMQGPRAVPGLHLQPPGAATWLGMGLFEGAAFRLESFDPDCSPAHLVFERGRERLTVDLHFHPGPSAGVFTGAVLLPKGRLSLLGRLRALAGGTDLLGVELQVTDDRVTVRTPSVVEWRFGRRP